MYKPTIGLEIHIELNTTSKMFCSCRNDSAEDEPNKNICPVCLAHPGTLPVANVEAIKKLVKTALALNCQINKHSFFERKNYFYPDLPKGYQISQYQAPISQSGYLELPQSNKKIRLTRIHLEEDTGSLIHPTGADYSLVNFNRSGVPLMELVSEPDLETVSEVKNFIKELQLILRYLDVSGANMEKGEMRCEINISLAPKGAKQFGTKVEVKNLNSIAVAGAAVEYEIKRQTEILEKGEKVIQETRGWHDTKRLTFSQRQKEEAHDYRYFPEPDLPPLNLADEFIEQAKRELIELPSQKRKRFKEEYALTDKDTDFYVARTDIAEYFEQVVSELRNWVKEKKFKEEISQTEFKKMVKLTSNYLSSDIQGIIKEMNESVNLPALIKPENFAEFVSMVYLNEISSRIAKTVLAEMLGTGKDPSQIIEEKGLKQISNTAEIENIAKEVIKENSKSVEDYKKGKTASLQFLIGQVMAKTKGKASPEIAKEILCKILNG